MLLRYLHESTIIFVPKSSLQHPLYASPEDFVLLKNCYSTPAMEGYPIQQVSSWETALSDIKNVLDTRRHDWRSCLPTARGIIALLEDMPRGLEPLNLDNQIRVALVLQRLAYEDADNGAQMDISTWCERHWATILQNFPDNLRALQGNYCRPHP